MNESGASNIAILLACHNRKQKTLSFLRSLVAQNVLKKITVDIYLLDDGSTDGTADAVKDKYPYINIVAGTGDLFWAGGMRVLWEYVITQKSYTLFCLFNDDVVLYDDALENLMQNHKRAGTDGVILIGSTLDPKTKEISYGGYKLKNTKHSKFYLVKPDETTALSCHLGNANILLVDSVAVQKIGIFSDYYTHCLADYDYTYTAFKSGINVLIAPGYYGYCENDHRKNWISGSQPLKERIDYLYSPKGLAYKEYLYFIKKNFPLDYVGAFIKLWMKTLLPIFWDKFKREAQYIESSHIK